MTINPQLDKETETFNQRIVQAWNLLLSKTDNAFAVIPKRQLQSQNNLIAHQIETLINRDLGALETLNVILKTLRFRVRLIVYPIIALVTLITLAGFILHTPFWLSISLVIVDSVAISGGLKVLGNLKRRAMILQLAKPKCTLKQIHTELSLDREQV